MSRLNVNPCVWRNYEFTYEPGNIAHIINVRIIEKVGDRTGIVPINALVFADNQLHAIQILREMLEMRIAEGNHRVQHIHSVMAQAKNASYYDADMDRAKHSIEYARAILAAVHNPMGSPFVQITVEQVNRNHMHRISWAANDTFLQ